MMRLRIIIITPTIVARIAFSLSPPGRLMNLDRFGLIKDPIPMSNTMMPTRMRIRFGLFM